MRAIEEVGYKKTAKFLFFVIVQVVYHNLIDHMFRISHIRKLFLEILGARFGKDTILMDVHFFNWHHTGPGGFKTGTDCFIGDETLIDLYDKVTLEDQVTIAQKVIVLTHINVGYKNHPLQKTFPKKSAPVIFKKGCVIGAGSIILSGVIIGERSFVAAGSVVSKDVPSNTLVGGVPAKKLKTIGK